MSHLDWPFFEQRHRDLAARIDRWSAANLDHAHGPDTDTEARNRGYKVCPRCAANAAD